MKNSPNDEVVKCSSIMNSKVTIFPLFIDIHIQIFESVHCLKLCKQCQYVTFDVTYNVRVNYRI